MRRNFLSALRSILTVAFLLAPAAVFAAGYVPLEPLPFVPANASGLPELLQGLFKLLIIGGAGIATLMVTIGGIQYMTGDAMHQKAEGKSRIQNSVLGLILLLFIYLLLKTINPQLLNFDLKIDKVGQKSTEQNVAERRAQGQRDAAAAAAQPDAYSSTPGTTDRTAQPPGQSFSFTYQTSDGRAITLYSTDIALCTREERSKGAIRGISIIQNCSSVYGNM